MSEVVCTKCGLVDDYRTQLKSGQNTAWCNGCGSFIKNIPQEEPTFYVGKYKGKKVSEIDDLGYLKWAKKEMKLSASMRAALDHRISWLENLAR